MYQSLQGAWIQSCGPEVVGKGEPVLEAVDERRDDDVVALQLAPVLLHPDQLGSRFDELVEDRRPVLLVGGNLDDPALPGSLRPRLMLGVDVRLQSATGGTAFSLPALAA